MCVCMHVCLCMYTSLYVSLSLYLSSSATRRATRLAERGVVFFDEWRTLTKRRCERKSRVLRQRVAKMLRTTTALGSHRSKSYPRHQARLSPVNLPSFPRPRPCNTATTRRKLPRGPVQILRSPSPKKILPIIPRSVSRAPCPAPAQKENTNKYQ